MSKKRKRALNCDRALDTTQLVQSALKIAS